MHQFDKLIPKKWSKKADFYRDLMEVLFELDKNDKEAVEKVLEAVKNTKFEDMLNKSPDWLWQRIRRYVPEPARLEERFRAFWQKWKTAMSDDPAHKADPDSNTCTPGRQFGKKADKLYKNMLAAIRKDQISDPPGVNLYEVKGIDRYKLTVYRCFRGTNNNESFHNKLNEGLVTENCTIEFTDHTLAGHIFRHDVSIDMSRGVIPRSIGHFELWTTDKIQVCL